MSLTRFFDFINLFVFTASSFYDFKLDFCFSPFLILAFDNNEHALLASLDNLHVWLSPLLTLTDT